MHEEVTLAQVRDWLLRYADRIDECADYLTELDAAIGDADHGVNMVRGMAKLRTHLLESTFPNLNSLLRTVAMTLIGSVGGAAGPLFGAFFLRAAKEISSEQSVTLAQLVQMVRSGLEGVQQRGKARLAEKTMVDVLHPAVEALEHSLAESQSLGQALEQARAAAERGMVQTIGLEATKGRASYLGSRSIGHQDPGATSTYYLFETLASTINGASNQNHNHNVE